MIEMSLAEVADVTGGRLHRATGAERVTAVEFDSRAVGPGGLFLALPGERADGTTSPLRRSPPVPPRCWRRGRSTPPR